MTDPKTAVFEATLNFEDEDGTDIPVEVSIRYPENHGLRVIHAVTELYNRTSPILARMAHTGDESVRAAMDDVGLSYEVEDDND